MVIMKIGTKVRCGLAAAALLAFPFLSGAQGDVSYALSRTVLDFNVVVEQEVFQAGPYARYAQKYLGVAARLSDASTCRIVEVGLDSHVEPDQSARYSFQASSASLPAFVEMTSMGLVSLAPCSGPGVWKFAPALKTDFRSVPANLTNVAGMLKRKGGDLVRQNALAEKPEEQKAKEVAERIFDIREYRYRILVGDTDATYSGEAMQATMNELAAMEEELMSLFLGKSEYRTLSGLFELIPDKSVEGQFYIPFRLSDEEGPVVPDNMTGKPVYVQITVEESPVSALDLKNRKPGSYVVYRIPSVCTVKLFEGTTTYLVRRMPVFQFGQLGAMPLAYK